MLLLAKSYQMYHCHRAVFTTLYQIQASLLFNDNITDSEVGSDTKFWLVMLQSEAPFILYCIYSLICPQIMDHLIYAMRAGQFWSQSSEFVTVPSQYLGRGVGWGWGGIKS